MPIQIKRIYEPSEPGDGHRVFIDRLWPRGLTKERAHFDVWLKELAPSTELRRWFGHDPEKWEEFKARYFRELDEQPEAMARIVERATADTVTLVFGARAERYSNAAALKEYLEGRRNRDRSTGTSGPNRRPG